MTLRFVECLTLVRWPPQAQCRKEEEEEKREGDRGTKWMKQQEKRKWMMMMEIQIEILVCQMRNFRWNLASLKRKNERLKEKSEENEDAKE